MSFLDEELDEPPRRSGSRRPPPRGPGVDSQTLWVRRGIAIAVGIVVVLVLVLGVRSCVSARKKQAFRNYGRDVTSLVQESNQERDQLFNLLRAPASGTPSPVDLTNNANGVKVQSEQLVDRANGTSHPGEMNTAHRYLVDVLEFRRDGIAAIAKDLNNALGDTGRQQATQQIAADMQNFLTSDVIYTQRFTPEYEKQLQKQGLQDEIQVPKSQFLPDINWLLPTVVADRISRIRGGGGTTSSTTVTPGLHGTSLGSVTVKPGGQTLSATQAVEIPVSSNPSFDVQVTNGGDSDESNVKVRVTIGGAGKPIVVEQTIATFPKGSTQTVNVALNGQTPATGQPVSITVQVLPVPGETKVDNNKAKFSAIFTR
ncbi:MAG: hypothetical protein ACXVRH_09185 [Thermoleophilaceae bacterium]